MRLSGTPIRRAALRAASWRRRAEGERERRETGPASYSTEHSTAASRGSRSSRNATTGCRPCRG
eukprot:scaffold10897_cov102-Isochrysis_galbana.AAC.1